MHTACKEYGDLIANCAAKYVINNHYGLWTWSLAGMLESAFPASPPPFLVLIKPYSLDDACFGHCLNFLVVSDDFRLGH